MDNNRSIEKQRNINATSAEVWHVLTQPELIKQWLGVTIRTDWTVGSPIAFSFEWEGKAFEDKGHVLAFDEHRAFSYDYWSAFSNMPDSPENYSVIAFRITDNERQSVLSLHHSRFSTPTMYEHSDANWEETLDTVKGLAEGLHQR
ncbi:SRPBCC domain-containing protein [Paenibacillus sp. MBLB4367]|uniref:SRPBCC family protein n=1 Tax=Paenibacillus sp. MBLB4367 TaxID=3384767 RepID=UPI003907EA41